MPSPDHAATVRAFLDNCVPGLTTPDVADAQAALDALIAALARVEHERDGVQALLNDANDAYLTMSAQYAKACNERDIEQERNPNRVICPKCQANLPCESCARYSVLRDSLERRAERAERQRDQAIEALRTIHTSPICFIDCTERVGAVLATLDPNAAT